MADSRNTFNFPPPSVPTRKIDWQTLCDMADATQDIVVAYTFGGSGPTTVKMVNGVPFGLSNPTSYSRMFVEYYPYAWNPNNPDYTGI